MIYRIYPPIGIARVGNSDAFFIGPETPGSLGTEIVGGAEQPVASFKDAAFRMKRQAARFRLFEFDDANGVGRPARVPAGASLQWTVSLANRKDAVFRQSAPDTEQVPPTVPALPKLDQARANRVIAADGVAPAPGAAATVLSGTYLTGTALEERVVLGGLMTDADGHLLVMGGRGISRSPEDKPIGDEFRNGETGGDFYNNRGWYDDVSDGSVRATIVMPDGSRIEAEPAWVIVAPPDFAPATSAIVTLYDVLVQIAIGRHELTLPAKPSFARDIWPLLRRAAGLVWVNTQPDAVQPSVWSSFNTNYAALADTSGAAAPLRLAEGARLRSIRTRRWLANFSLRPWQLDYVAAWERGDFISDFTGTLPDAGVLSPQTLTRTALDGSAGQGFFPGIEGGIVLTNPTLYSAPFRLAASVLPGTLTALMALPWQADFLKCEGNWWPSQRPDSAAQADDPDTFLPWRRPVGDSGHRDLVAQVCQLGVIAPKQIGGREVLVETGRDPALPS
jgi:hypothetical protein